MRRPIPPEDTLGYNVVMNDVRALPALRLLFMHAPAYALASTRIDVFERALAKTDGANVQPGEMVRLGSAADVGPALYWVSDPPGDVSPPHVHDTWSVSVLLRGSLEHTLYAPHGPASRTLRALRRIRVGEGDVLAMGEREIHVQRVTSREATLELHLYGAPLDRLRWFAERSDFVIEGE